MIGDEGNGIYSSAYYIYTFFLVLSSAGLPAAISKMVSERVAKGRHNDAYKVFRIALISATVLGCVCFAALYFGADSISRLIQQPRSYYSIMTLSPTVLIVAIIAVFRGYFQGVGNVAPSAVSQVVDQVFNAVFSVLCAHLLMKAVSNDPVALGAAGGTLGTGIGALAGLAFIVFMFYLAYPAIRQSRAADRHKGTEPGSKITGELFATAVPIILGTAVFAITNLIDAVMIMGRLTNGAGFAEKTATDLYGQVTGKYVVLTTLPISISTAFAAAAIPSIAASRVKGDYENVKRKINSAIRLTMLFTIPAAVGLGVLGPQIIELLFPNVPGGGELLSIGAVSIIFLSLTQITTGMLQSIGKVRIPVIAAVFGALVKIPFNYFLIAIPSINVKGAVISTIACYIVASGIDWMMLCRITKLKPDYKGILIKPLFSALLMGFSVYVSYYLSFFALGRNSVSVLVSVVFGIGVYFAFMAFTNGLNSEDVRQIPLVRRLLK